MDIPENIVPNDASNTGPYPLSQEQIDSYWENGYIIIKELFDVQTLNSFRERFLEICNNPESRRHYSWVKDKTLYKVDLNPEMYINKIQELLYDPIYSAYSESPVMLHIVAQIIGSDNLTALNCMLINKPPGSTAHPAHQDLYYFPIRPADKIIATWTAVDHVTRNNGCLFVVPGSHKVDSMYIHKDIAAVNNQFFHGIAKADIIAPLDKRVDLVMSPGDTVFFHPYLVHGSWANNSQGCRKSMTAHYTASCCHYIQCEGTAQEVLADDMEEEIRRRGGDFLFADLWRIKSKPLRNVKCNL